MKTIKNFITRTNKPLFINAMILSAIAGIVVFMWLHTLEHGIVYQIVNH